MRLMINPDVTPPTYHSPLPVPVPWKDAIKDNLDKDVRLDVLEPVPIRELVIWYYCMVICAKQNSTPKGTIDFQPLNLHATRGTHHTQSTFRQAKSVLEGKKKTAFDAWNGYHSVPLHPNNNTIPRLSPLGATTDITRPCEATSGDGYTRK